MVQGETKTSKNIGVLQSKFCMFTGLKDGHFSWKMNIGLSVQNLTFHSTGASFFKSTAKFFYFDSQLYWVGTAKNAGFRAQNSVKNNFFTLFLETYLAWKFLFLCTFLNNCRLTFEKN